MSVCILLSLSLGSVGMIFLNDANASFKLWVRCRSLTFAITRCDCKSSNVGSLVCFFLLRTLYLRIFPIELVACIGDAAGRVVAMNGALSFSFKILAHDIWLLSFFDFDRLFFRFLGFGWVLLLSSN